jgi:hypothetical protein
LCCDWHPSASSGAVVLARFDVLVVLLLVHLVDGAHEMERRSQQGEDVVLRFVISCDAVVRDHDVVRPRR